MKQKRFDPIDRDILRVLAGAKMPATPTKVARAIGIHPATARTRIENFRKEKIVDCKERGNRLMCKINRSAVSKRKFF